jgi:hypothetical protein
MNLFKKKTQATMEMTLKQNIPQSKVTRDINMVPISIVDHRILLMFNVPNITKSSIYSSNDNGDGKIEVWHSNGDGTWDCVLVS